MRNKKIACFLAVLLCIIFIFAGCIDKNATVKPPSGVEYEYYDNARDISGERQLFLDTLLIDEDRTTADAVLNSPVRTEEVILFNDSWQGNCCDYFTTFEDVDENGQKFYRMYYIGRWIYSDIYPDILRVCYAYSYDGYDWIFPELGLREVDGNKNNNVLLDHTDQQFDNFFVFKDTNPDCNPQERYKALAEYFILGAMTELRAWVSPDGINWTCKGTVLPSSAGTFDSLNTCYYDAEIGKYVMYSRAQLHDENGAMVRAIQRSESEDFYNWSTPVPITYTDGKNMQMYTNNISRYYRAEQYFIGYPTRYTSPDEISSDKNRVTDSIFMYSRDGYEFYRKEETWILNRPQDDINWTYGDSYFSAGIVQTKDAYGNDVMSFYTNEDRFSLTGTKMVKYDMRLDGFVSYNALGKTAQVCTKPVRFNGGSLTLNYQTGVGGRVIVSIEDKNGNTVLRSDVLTGDYTDRVVFDQSQLECLQNKGCVIKIQLYDAKVFSYMFS